MCPLFSRPSVCCLISKIIYTVITPKQLSVVSFMENQCCQVVVFWMLIVNLYCISEIHSPWGRGRMGRGGRKLALCLVATLLAAWVLYRLLTSCAGWDDHRPIMMPRNVSALLMQDRILCSYYINLSMISIHVGVLSSFNRFLTNLLSKEHFKTSDLYICHFLI